VLCLDRSSTFSERQLTSLNEDQFVELARGDEDRFVKLTREGWEHFRDHDLLINLYPECGDHTNIDGEWFMI
jgi:hypothetical protein